MRVKRNGYVGLRTDDVDAMTSFFRDVIGLEAAGGHVFAIAQVRD